MPELEQEMLAESLAFLIRGMCDGITGINEIAELITQFLFANDESGIAKLAQVYPEIWLASRLLRKSLCTEREREIFEFLRYPND
jgi:hypothetical protein